MRYNMGAQHPMKPIRLQMTMQLLDSYGLFDGALKLVEPGARRFTEEVALTHDPEFIAALAAIYRGETLDNPYRFGLGTGDNPIFDDIYEASMRYSGASIQAAQAVYRWRRRRQHSIFPAGCTMRTTVAPKARGSACLTIARWRHAAAAAHTLSARVAYVDIDVHHGDGVQELFYNDPSVLTISIHEVGRGFFPGTGYVDEIGEGEGEGYAVNVPVAPDTTDETWLMAWREAALPLLKAFKPEAIVLQMGADPHYMDPLANVCLTAQGWLEAVRDVHSLGLPIVAVGGGGYNLSTVTRLWASAVSVLIDHPLPNDVPESYQYRAKIPYLLDTSGPNVSKEARAYALTGSRRRRLKR